MKFGIKNGFKIMKKGVDMDHEIYSTTRIFSRMSRLAYPILIRKRLRIK